MICRRKMLQALGALTLISSNKSVAQEVTGTEIFDVVVIGAGGAGLAAALSAAQNGCSVVVLEKADFIGGDTLISGGYFNVADSRSTTGDTPQKHAKEMLDVGGGHNDPALVATFTQSTSETIEWLKKQGMQFLPGARAIYGGGYARAHKPTEARGRGYIRVLSEACLKNGVQIRTKTQAEELLTDEKKRVIGVSAVEKNVQKNFSARRAVVVATGGFGASKEMLKEYAPELVDYPTDTLPTATGDGHRMLEKVGAKLVNMHLVECVTGSPGQQQHPVRLDYSPDRVLLINREARRFIDEQSSRMAISRAILRQPDDLVWAVTDQETVDMYDELTKKHIYQGLHAGVVYRAETIETLAQRIGVSAKNLKQTVNVYVQEKPATPMKFVPKNAPFWAVRVVLHIHTTLGGVAIDTAARCLGVNGKPIEGLFAAGEIVGNLHGENRLGGNGVASTMVFGRIAGINAAKNF